MDMNHAPLILLSIVLAILFGLITALIARAKGRNFIGWWIYGALSSPIAIFHALLMAPKKYAGRRRGLSSAARRRCPHCGEAIKLDVEVCPQCWRVLPAGGITPEEGDDA